MKNIKLYVSGTHCKACKTLIEETLEEQPDIRSAQVDLSSETVSIESASDKKEAIQLKEWSAVLEKNGYALHAQRPEKKISAMDLIKGVSIGLVALASFFSLQKSGILNIGFGDMFSPLTAFFIGIVASLSSCLAIVGGLVLSLSAKAAKGGATKKPIALFHAGRIVGFAFLGGVLGFAGSAVSVNHTVSALLGIIVSGVMILLGINLLDIIHGAWKWQPTFGRGLFERFARIEESFSAPILIGIGTFFLPCGFTQSMQLAALSSASFLQGSVIMLLFALGTFPVLLALSFGSLRFSSSPYASVFFKASGTIVIGLGLFSLLSGLAALGVIRPFFNL